MLADAFKQILHMIRIGRFGLKCAVAFMLFVPLLGPSLADWRTNLNTFRIGVVSNQEANVTIARLAPFRLAVENALGVDATIVPISDFPALIDAHGSGRIDYAIYSSMAFASATALCDCVVPLVSPRASDQSQAYKAILISAPDGPQSIGDVVPSDVGILRPNHLGATSFALYHLKVQGVDLGEASGVRVYENAETMIGDLLAKEIKAAIGWSSLAGDAGKGYSRGTLNSIAKRNQGSVEGYRILWRSLPIPHPPHAVRKALDEEAVKLLTATLEEMFSKNPSAYDTIEPVFGGGFHAVKPEVFDPLVSYVKTEVTLSANSE